MKCRHCKTNLIHQFVDLINSPLSNSFLKKEQLNEPEVFYPLKIYVCHSCFLVQIDEYKNAQEIFNNEYVYYSSFSKSWVEHARVYVDMMVEKYEYNPSSFIVEIASNDGYLLQFFSKKGIPVLGVEPTLNTANEARKKGIESINDFWGYKLAEEKFSKKKADLLIGNNVLAHVPDINDFVAGLKIALSINGIITMEFPHLVNLIKEVQFDTIYHEHFSYLSLTTVITIFKSKGLKIFDVEEIKTHGGSLRIYATHSENELLKVNNNVSTLLDFEKKQGITDILSYSNFQEKVDKIKLEVLDFLISCKKNNKKVIAYGAAAKGNTLLNYCGIKSDILPCCIDASTYKQDLFMPGSHIPVISPKKIKEIKPDFILILPWNLKNEIKEEYSFIKDWGGKFVVPIPRLTIVE